MLNSFTRISTVNLYEPVDMVGMYLLRMKAEHVNCSVCSFTQLTIVTKQLLQEFGLRLLVLVFNDKSDK